MSCKPLLIVQPSADYAGRVRQHFPDAVLLATPARAVELGEHPRVVKARLDDPEATHGAVSGYARSHGLYYGGIACFVCEYLPLTAYLAGRLDLSFASEESVRLTRRKELATAAWAGAGLSVPRSRPVRHLEELLEFAREVPPPWVLKPMDRSGSEWVLKVEQRADLEEAHCRIQEGLAEGGDPQAVSYLVQQFVSGREFGADILVEDGRARLMRLTEKYLMQEPGLAGLVGAYYLAQVEARTCVLLEDAFARAAHALGIERGLAMVDVILSGQTPYLLEMALRPGGDCLPDLCRLGLGYDPIRTAGRIALGLPPDIQWLPRPRPLAALHLMTDRSGRVRRLDCAALLAHPRVEKLIEVYHPPGDQLRCWDGRYDDRIVAACLARCADPGELPSLCAELSGLIDLELEESESTVST
jgi:hypothetical protein